jgi:hypothetical protein
MRQPYEQNLDLNYRPVLTYEECLKIVKGLEAVRRCHLTNTPIVERAARLMQRNQIHHLPSLNLFIENMAGRALQDMNNSSAIPESQKPITLPGIP